MSSSNYERTVVEHYSRIGKWKAIIAMAEEILDFLEKERVLGSVSSSGLEAELMFTSSQGFLI
jgi:hypothetical protein